MSLNTRVFSLVLFECRYLLKVNSLLSSKKLKFRRFELLMCDNFRELEPPLPVSVRKVLRFELFNLFRLVDAQTFRLDSWEEVTLLPIKRLVFV